MGAQVGVAQLGAHQHAQGVVLALAVGAQVLAGGVLAGFAVDHRGVVVGVGHAGCGELGEPGVQFGPQLRGGDQLSGAHAVGALGTGPGEPTLQRAVLIGELPIRIEREGHPCGHGLELIGAQGGGLVGQGALSGGGLHRADSGGQIAQELLDDREVLAVEDSGVPGFGGALQQRGQGLAGQGTPRRQLCGVAHPVAGFGAGDAQHVGQGDVRGGPAGWLLQAGHHGVRYRALAARRGLQALQHRVAGGCGESVDVEARQFLEDTLEIVEHRGDRTHV